MYTTKNGEYEVFDPTEIYDVECAFFSKQVGDLPETDENTDKAIYESLKDSGLIVRGYDYSCGELADLIASDVYKTDVFREAVWAGCASWLRAGDARPSHESWADPK